MKYYTKATLVILLGLFFIVGSGGGGGGEKNSANAKSYSILLESVELTEPNGTEITVDGLPLQGREVEVK